MKSMRTRIIISLLVVASGSMHATEVPTTEHTIDSAFGDAQSIFAADVDGDGDMDILGAASTDNDIAWWENPGGAATTDGTPWTEHTIDASFGGASSVYAADVDGDGNVDILGAASTDNDIAWWENPGGAATTDGTPWAEHTIDASFGGASSVYAADVDGDGNVDILGAASTDNDIAWWENPGGAATTDGTPWAEHTIDASFSGAQSVFATDVDNDGNIDILGAASTDDDIAWWENPGGAATTDGTPWTEHTIDASFSGAQSVFATDVDNDGNIDILGAASTDDDIAWWENPGGAATTDGTPWTEHTIDASFDGAVSVYAADVDGDGDTDILGTGNIDDDITWWENPGGAATTDGTPWTERTIDGSFDGASSVHVADVDGDGDTDVLGAAATDDDIVWWENKTIHHSALFPIEHTIDANFDGATSVLAADINGDGNLDVLGAAFDADDIAWWENPGGAATTDGTAWTEHPVDSDFDGARVVSVADVDGDGDLDVLGAAFDADDIAWWENTAGDGTAWTEHAVDSDFDGARSVAAGDIDGDGDLDILGAAFEADDIVWWENTAGNGTAWTEHTIDDDFLEASSVAAADLDGDGDLDVSGAGQSGAVLAQWENTNGDGTVWTEPTTRPGLTGFVLFPADLDADGDLDFLGANQTTDPDSIAWLEIPSFALNTIDGNFAGAISVFAADLDGDGDLDALAAADVDDDITWWENRGGQFALPTLPSATTHVAPPTDATVLRVNPVHKGRTGDTDAELVTLELLLDDGVTPLTDAQANSAIDSLSVYLDDGSGIFDASDTQVATAGPLSLTAGVQTMSFVDGDMNVQLPFGSTPLFFVVIDFKAGSTFNPLRVTHLTQSSSTGEDRDHDIPLKLEYLANVSTTQMVILGGPGAGQGCPTDLGLADQTLSGTQTLQAITSATLGENLIINGASIDVKAPTVTILGNTTISGPFSIGNTPSCP